MPLLDIIQTEFLMPIKKMQTNKWVSFWTLHKGSLRSVVFQAVKKLRFRELKTKD